MAKMRGGYALQILDSFYTFTIEIAAVDLFFNILYPRNPKLEAQIVRGGGSLAMENLIFDHIMRL